MAALSPAAVFASDLSQVGVAHHFDPIGKQNVSTANFDIPVTKNQQLTFAGSHTTALEQNTENQLRLQYSWDMTDQLNFNFKVTTDYADYSTTKTVHRLDFLQRLPSKSFSSNLRLFWQKQEHVKEQTGIEFNLSRMLRYNSKPLIRIRAKTGWNQQIVGGAIKLRQETQWIMSRKFKLTGGRSIGLTGTFKWRDERSTNVADKTDFGGLLQARLSLTPKLNLAFKHVAEDVFNSELTQVSGKYSGNLWHSDISLEAGTDNNHNGWLQLSTLKSWR